MKKISRKQMALVVAAVVSMCFIICLVSTVEAVSAALQAGLEVPYGMVMLTVLTMVCTVVIWKGVREMKD